MLSPAPVAKVENEGENFKEIIGDAFAFTRTTSSRTHLIFKASLLLLVVLVVVAVVLLLPLLLGVVVEVVVVA
jgi:hypothetical protein